MRLESTIGDSREVKVWLTDDDVDGLRRAAASQRDDVLVQLGAYVGLRAFELPQVQPQHVDTTDGGTYRLRVPRGKDTTGAVDRAVELSGRGVGDVLEVVAAS